MDLHQKQILDDAIRFSLIILYNLINDLRDHQPYVEKLPPQVVQTIMQMDESSSPKASASPTFVSRSLPSVTFTQGGATLFKSPSKSISPAMTRESFANKIKEKLAAASAAATIRTSIFQPQSSPSTAIQSFAGQTSVNNSIGALSTSNIIPAAPKPNNSTLLTDRAARFASEPEDNRYLSLKEGRDALRLKYIREGKMADPDAQYQLGKAPEFIANCTDMCPEFERHEREFQSGGLHEFEKIPGTTRIDHARAVKRYKRSAAGDPPPLPCDVRPPPVLIRTLDYLFNHILQTHGLAKSYSFVRDRARAIRNDLTLQNYRGPEAVDIHEKIARYHIVCSYELCEKMEVSLQQEHEQLRKTLQSLLEFYKEMATAGVQMPNEAEFQAYYIATHPYSHETISRAERLPKAVFLDPQVQSALHIVSLMSRINEDRILGRPSSDGSIHYYSRVIQCIRQAPFLLACCFHMSLVDIRKGALKTMQRAYYAPTQERKSLFCMQDLTLLLGCDDETEMAGTLVYYGIPVLTIKNQLYACIGKVKSALADGKARMVKGVFFEDQTVSFPPRHSAALIDFKRKESDFVSIIQGHSPPFALPTLSKRKSSLSLVTGDIAPVLPPRPAIPSPMLPKPSVSVPSLVMNNSFAQSPSIMQISPVQKVPSQSISMPLPSMSQPSFQAKFPQTQAPAPICQFTTTSIPQTPSAINSFSFNQSSDSVASILPVPILQPRRKRSVSPEVDQSKGRKFSSISLPQQIPHLVTISTTIPESIATEEVMIKPKSKLFSSAQIDEFASQLVDSLLTDNVSQQVRESICHELDILAFRLVKLDIVQSLVDEVLAEEVYSIAAESTTYHEQRVAQVRRFVWDRWRFVVARQQHRVQEAQRKAVEYFLNLRQESAHLTPRKGTALFAKNELRPMSALKQQRKDTIEVGVSNLEQSLDWSSLMAARPWTSISPLSAVKKDRYWKLVFYIPDAQFSQALFASDWMLHALAGTSHEPASDLLYYSNSVESIIREEVLVHPPPVKSPHSHSRSADTSTNSTLTARTAASVSSSWIFVNRLHIREAPKPMVDNAQSLASGASCALFQMRPFLPSMIDDKADSQKLKTAFWDQERTTLYSFLSNLPKGCRIPLLLVFWSTEQLTWAEFQLEVYQLNLSSIVQEGPVSEVRILHLACVDGQFDSSRAIDALSADIKWLIQHSHIPPTLSWTFAQDMRSMFIPRLHFFIDKVAPHVSRKMTSFSSAFNLLISAYNHLMRGLEKTLCHSSYSAISVPPVELEQELDWNRSWNVDYSDVNAFFAQWKLPPFSSSPSSTTLEGVDLLRSTLSLFWRDMCRSLLAYSVQLPVSLRKALFVYIINQQDSIRFSQLFGIIMDHMVSACPWDGVRGRRPFIPERLTESFETASNRILSMMGDWLAQQPKTDAKLAHQDAASVELRLPSSKIRRVEVPAVETQSSLRSLMAKARLEIQKNQELLHRLEKKDLPQ